MISASEALTLIKANPKVAIVGLSPKEDRPSYHVGQFLAGHDFKITPIHPAHPEIMGFAAKASLAELSPGEVDWIDLFLNPDRLMDLVDEIKRLKPKLVWCQIGVVNEEFNALIEGAGIPLIANVCPKIEWSRHG
ncbi:MAG: CoA-binding protein [bacterium]|nr:CoA-binding protein [bacterium]